MKKRSEKKEEKKKMGKPKPERDHYTKTKNG